MLIKHLIHFNKLQIMKKLVTSIALLLITSVIYSQLPNADNDCPPTPCNKKLSSQIQHNIGGINSLSLRVDNVEDSVDLIHLVFDSIGIVQTRNEDNIGKLVRSVESLDQCCVQVEIPWVIDDIQYPFLDVNISTNSTYQYKIIGSTIFLNFEVLVNSVNTDIDDITIDLPQGTSPIRESRNCIMADIDSGFSPVFATVNLQNKLLLVRDHNKKWKATNNPFSIIGGLVYEKL